MVCSHAFNSPHRPSGKLSKNGTKLLFSNVLFLLLLYFYNISTIFIARRNPVCNYRRSVKICKGHRTDIVKLGTIAEHIALPALLHGSCFNCRFIGIRGSTATLSGKSIGSKKAFGKMITTNRIRSLITNYCFCSTLQLSTYKTTALVTNTALVTLRNFRISPVVVPASI